MDARAQDLFRFPHVRIGELREREIGLHRGKEYRAAAPLSWRCASALRPSLRWQAANFVR
jgi:hypothetical protein